MKAMVQSLSDDWRESLGLRGKRARTALYLLAAGLLGLILMMLNSLMQPGEDPARTGAGEEPEVAQQVSPEGAAEPSELSGHEVALEASLGEILAQVEGAGAVRVRVHLAQGPTYEYEQDSRVNERVTEEEDAQGGSRVTRDVAEELQTVFAGGTSGEPVVRSIGNAQVRGVLVVAEGAGDPQVRDRLTRAVEILLDLPLHRVYVVQGEGG